MLLVIDQIYILLLVFCNISTTVEKIFNPKKLPTIIWWSNLLFPHDKSISEIKCSSFDCLSSKSRPYKTDTVKIGYIFYGTDFHGESLPLPRKRNHIWALLHEESPMNNYIFSHSVGIKLFNFTATFSRHSDFPLTTQHLPSLDYLTSRKPISTIKKNNFRKNGTAMVLYLQSHCNVASDRDSYIEKLMQHIEVDSYGTCLKNKELPLQLVSTSTYDSEELFAFISKYKFHLAFENAICNDYITEKLFRTLHVGSVPIYKGSASVSDWAPAKNSIIDINKFKHPSELAEFLISLDQNDHLYEEFLDYKKEGISNPFLSKHVSERSWGVNDITQIDFIRGFECFICRKLHEMTEDSLPSIGEKLHMGCPQPHPSIESGSNLHDNKWLQEGWIENYWFAFDQAQAIEMMIQNNESSTSNFMYYITKLKYNN